jgi:hypothetical protein
MGKRLIILSLLSVLILGLLAMGLPKTDNGNDEPLAVQAEGLLQLMKTERITRP